MLRPRIEHMNRTEVLTSENGEVTATVRHVSATLASVRSALFEQSGLDVVDDHSLLDLTAEVAALSHTVEAIHIALADQVQDRVATRPKDEQITTRAGCRNATELLRRVTRDSRSTVSRRLKAARAIHQDTAMSAGGYAEARYPALRHALAESGLGLDSVLAVAGPLDESRGRAPGPGLLRAQRLLTATATGVLPPRTTGDDIDDVEERRMQAEPLGPPADADHLAAMARTWADYLDQDGAEPRDEVAMRKRGLVLSPAENGLIRIHGHLLPDVAGRLRRQLDAILSPRARGGATAGVPGGTDAPSRAGAAAGKVVLNPADSGRTAEAAPGAFEAPPDERTHSQKQHDALAALLDAAAGAGDMPLLGGAAPTLVVTAREEDLVAERGHARIDAVGESVPSRVARQIGCLGAIYRVVMDGRGRITSLKTEGRVFTAVQRRAIAARDGGCVIPGCDIRAEWCELHHIREWADAGETHTDNGVCICWFHHRTLETSGWSVRMRGGVPEVRAPRWWDPERRWRAANGSRVLQQDLLEQRAPIRAGMAGRPPGIEQPPELGRPPGIEQPPELGDPPRIGRAGP